MITTVVTPGNSTGLLILAVVLLITWILVMVRRSDRPRPAKKLRRPQHALPAVRADEHLERFPREDDLGDDTVTWLRSLHSYDYSPFDRDEGGEGIVLPPTAQIEAAPELDALPAPVPAWKPLTRARPVAAIEVAPEPEPEPEGPVDWFLKHADEAIERLAATPIDPAEPEPASTLSGSWQWHEDQGEWEHVPDDTFIRGLKAIPA
jgi:hypothetical protein